MDDEKCSVSFNAREGTRPLASEFVCTVFRAIIEPKTDFDGEFMRSGCQHLGNTAVQMSLP